MQLQTGKRGRGRPKGSRNKRGKNLQEAIKKFLEEEFDEVKACFYELSARNRSKLYVDLLQFVVPKQQATSIEAKLGRIASDDTEFQDLLMELKQQHELQLRQQQPKLIGLEQPGTELQHTKDRQGPERDVDSNIQREEND